MGYNVEKFELWSVKMQRGIEYIKKNWPIVLVGIFLLGIIINDILEQFVWKTGMAFRANSMYVFLINIGLFVAMPILLIEHVSKEKYKDIKLEEYKERCESPKDVARIIFVGVGKLVFAVASSLGMVVLVAKMSEKVLENVIDASKPYIYISDFSHFPFSVGLGVIVLFVWMFSKKGIVIRDYSDDGKTDLFAAGDRARLPLRVKYGIAIGALIIFFLSIYATTLSYHCITEDGISHRCFWVTKQYAWNDVNAVTNRTIERGAQVIVLEMKDGHMVVLDEMLVENGAENLIEKLEFLQGER